MSEVDAQIVNFEEEKSASGSDRFFKTIIDDSVKDIRVKVKPNWHMFCESLQGLIKDPFEQMLNKFKRLLDDSVRADFAS